MKGGFPNGKSTFNSINNTLGASPIGTMNNTVGGVSSLQVPAGPMVQVDRDAIYSAGV